jgi:predicted Zn-dependent peptidase
LWLRAEKRKIGKAAKIQANASWELSAIPYIPVPYLVKEHIENLGVEGVDDIMLSWTVGGYPTPTLGLLDYAVEDIALELYGPAAK